MKVRAWIHENSDLIYLSFNTVQTLCFVVLAVLLLNTL